MNENPPQGGFFVCTAFLQISLREMLTGYGKATFFILIYNKGILYTAATHPPKSIDSDQAGLKFKIFSVF
ncbi:hypothetical protein [Komagataeibacter xylinus]|uniref:hypothetical protein n=1 Tax=Komagataeibacter xylinus TaxID=28448 RepID=UPI0010303C28|nr:hypothetical protein [Komagataeibacter xylinus]